jgi:hypothetical protein
MFDALWGEAMDGICRYIPLEQLAETLRAAPLPVYEGEVLGGPGIVQRARSAWRSSGLSRRGEGGKDGMDVDNPEDAAAAAAAVAARAVARAAAAAKKRAAKGPPPPTDLLPLPEGVPEQLAVVCNGTHGTLLLRPQRVLVGEQELTASGYEAMCGRGGAKKWKSSVWAADADGQPQCCMGDWLNARGLDKHELAKLAANYAAVEQRRLWEQEHPEQAQQEQQQQDEEGLQQQQQQQLQMQEEGVENGGTDGGGGVAAVDVEHVAAAAAGAAAADVVTDMMEAARSEGAAVAGVAAAAGEGAAHGTLSAAALPHAATSGADDMDMDAAQ